MMTSAIASISVCLLLAAAEPKFEVAAIRPHDPNSPESMMRFLPAGGLSVTGMSIRNLIWLAWKLPPERVTGGPKWLDTDLCDIQAKSAAGSATSMDIMYQRIQSLFADRLKLKVHRETKNTSVYPLTVAKTGLKMQEAKSSDPYSADKGSITPWSLFVTELSQRLGRTVIDKTGLNGTWYVKLRYSTDDGGPAGMGTGPIDRSQPDANTGPSIFTAVQEQLGLKLDSGTGPVDVLVIDSVERPSEN
jgi:uncharacterized protein (TIGR03435 family)